MFVKRPSIFLEYSSQQQHQQQTFIFLKQLEYCLERGFQDPALHKYYYWDINEKRTRWFVTGLPKDCQMYVKPQPFERRVQSSAKAPGCITIDLPDLQCHADGPPVPPALTRQAGSRCLNTSLKRTLSDMTASAESHCQSLSTKTVGTFADSMICYSGSTEAIRLPKRPRWAI